jgi:hypothetical protein
VLNSSRDLPREGSGEAPPYRTTGSHMLLVCWLFISCRRPQVQYIGVAGLQGGLTRGKSNVHSGSRQAGLLQILSVKRIISKTDLMRAQKKATSTQHASTPHAPLPSRSPTVPQARPGHPTSHESFQETVTTPTARIYKDLRSKPLPSPALAPSHGTNQVLPDQIQSHRVTSTPITSFVTRLL